MTNSFAAVGGREAAGEPVLLDACVVLSLFATGRLEEILTAAPRVVIARTVREEALFVYRVVDGQRERAPVDLAPAIAVGVLSEVDFANESEAAAFIDLALRLDDGEAASAAIAIHRGWSLATDDRRAIDVVGNRVPIVGTLDLVRRSADRQGVPREELVILFGRIRDRGYVPNAVHPHRAWWDSVLGRHFR